MVCLCPTRPFGAPAGVSVVSGAREVYRSAIVVGSVLAAGVDADSSDIGRGAVAPTDTDRGLVSLLNIVRTTTTTTTTTTTAGSHPAVSFAVELAHAALVVSGPVMGVVPVGGGRTDPELESMFAVNCVHSIELIRCDMDSSAEEDNGGGKLTHLCTVMTDGSCVDIAVRSGHLAAASLFGPLLPLRCIRLPGGGWDIVPISLPCEDAARARSVAVLGEGLIVVGHGTFVLAMFLPKKRDGGVDAILEADAAATVAALAPRAAGVAPRDGLERLEFAPRDATMEPVSDQELGQQNASGYVLSPLAACMIGQGINRMYSGRFGMLALPDRKDGGDDGRKYGDRDGTSDGTSAGGSHGASNGASNGGSNGSGLGSSGSGDAASNGNIPPSGNLNANANANADASNSASAARSARKRGPGPLVYFTADGQIGMMIPTPERVLAEALSATDALEARLTDALGTKHSEVWRVQGNWLPCLDATALLEAGVTGCVANDLRAVIRNYT
eukprot:TRINITY_DN8748_c0_g3_i1.p1 TRINITY_DN8748_c0_g3~~TRINITY_DN8748_c0_g3_i1.p1  ORF type:complete len:501 (-),score=200.27 TRINITY_DN8748_c0_g3_i1:30-1532(-)